MYPAPDLYVVGGGPAGLAAAIAARRRGLEVVVADGARPPIDKACGEGILPEGVAAARSLGIDIEGRAFLGIRFHDGAHTVEAVFPRGEGVGMRRSDLHTAMTVRAKALGVRLLWGAPAESLDGIRARWIVGADGAASRVRRCAGLDSRLCDARRFGFRRHYAVEPWSDRVEVWWTDRLQIYVTPLGAREVNVAVLCRDPRLRFDDAVAHFPRLVRTLGRSAAPVRAGVTSMRRLRAVHRGNVALIGDAAGSVDAITGDGLTLAFRHAGALASALETGDLADYAAAHRRLSRRARAMGNLLLLLDRFPALRRGVMRTFDAHPPAFARMLAVHTA
jgi:flavin-dependent dehydrogenase